jgi:predicted RNase H-like HicB family nuclease
LISCANYNELILLRVCFGEDLVDTAQIRVEYFYDPESRNWGFEVPSLGIIGGADTREEAEQQAIEAITFTLESDEEEEEEAPVPAEGEVGYLRVTVQR